MRDFHPDVEAALEQKQLVARDFLTAWPRDRESGLEIEKGFWSGQGTVSASVLNPLTATPATRSFRGVGTLIAIDDIPLVSNISVQRVRVQMSHIDDTVDQLLRLYDLQQARIQIFRGMFNKVSRSLVQAAYPRFVGFVNRAPLDRPAAGGEGKFFLECVSHTQEMDRSNPEVRSDESQKKRNATDNFFQDVGTVGEWDLRWGQSYGKLKTKPVTQSATQQFLNG